MIGRLFSPSIRLGVCGCDFSQVPYVASYLRELECTRESKHADNSAALTAIAVDLQDRHCFARTLCNSRRALGAS